jgi:hypothetical protein
MAVQQMAGTGRRVGLTAAAHFWYILGCIAFAGAYFAKVPVKKALSDFGLVRLTGAESFWYILMCIAFGAGYFAKIPAVKALSELQQFRDEPHDQLVSHEQSALPSQGAPEQSALPSQGAPEQSALPSQDAERQQDPGT